MPTPQKIVQTILRWTTPLLVLAALGGTTMDGIFATGKIWSASHPTLLANAPGGNFRALLYSEDTNSMATTTLVLEHHWHGLHLGQFTALEAPPQATVRVHWTDATTLHIACTGCDPGSTTLPARNWGKLHLSYDLQ